MIMTPIVVGNRSSLALMKANTALTVSRIATRSNIDNNSRSLLLEPFAESCG